MKLHLPKGLRRALMACMAVVTSLSTTVGTGIVAGGAITYMLAAPQASADFIWQGGSGNKTVEDWKLQDNWNADGSTWNTGGNGPGTTNSNMWDKIVIDGGDEGVVFGSESARDIPLEGWAPKYTLTNNVKMYVNMAKLQPGAGNTGKFSVTNNSLLDLQMGAGSFQQNSEIEIGENSSIIFRMQQTGSTANLTINMLHDTASIKFWANSNINHTGKVTLTPVIGELAAPGSWGSINLGIQTKNVTLSNLVINTGSALEGFSMIDTEITEENYSLYGNCYYIKKDGEGNYSLVYSVLDPNSVCVWEGGDLEWAEGSAFGAATFEENKAVKFTTADANVLLAEDITAGSVEIAENIKVTLTGDGHQLSTSAGVTINGTLELKDDALAEDCALSGGANGKLLIAGAIDMGDRLQGYTAGVEIAEGGELTIGNINNNLRITGTATDAAVILTKELVARDQFSGYAGDVVVTDGVRLFVGNGPNDNSAGSSNFQVGRVIVQEGGALWVHTSQKPLTSNLDMQSGSILGNKDQHPELSGTIRFNIVDPNADTAQYNAEGVVQAQMLWGKNAHWSGLIEGDGYVELQNSQWEAASSYKISNAGNTFAGHYVLTDGSGPGSDKTVTMEIAGTSAAAATVDMNNTTCKAVLKLGADATVKALTSLDADNTIAADAAAKLTITDGSEGFVGTVGQNVTLNLTGGSFNVTGTITNNGTINVNGGSIVVADPMLLDAKGEMTQSGWSVDGTDGFEVYGEQSFYLTKGGTATGLGEKLGDYTLSVDEDGSVLLTSDESYGSNYYANTKNLVATAEDAARATGYIVADGLTLEANNTGEAVTVDTVSIGTGSTLTLEGNVTLQVGGELSNGGTFNFGGTAIHATSQLNLTGNVNITSEVTVIGSPLHVLQGATLTLEDGSAINSEVRPSLHVKGALVVAANATSTITAVDDIHVNHQVSGAQIVLNEGSTLNLTALSLQMWGSDALLRLADNAVLSVNGNTVVQENNNVEMAEGSVIHLNDNSVLNLQPTTDQTLGHINLNGGKITSTNGSGDNRVKTFKKLSGSGTITGNNWNVIWNIEELAGEGDINWVYDGTHWAPSVFHVGGGEFTGTLTADRVAGKAGARGNYQSVLQINDGGAETLSGAVVNLNGQANDAWVQLALNADKVCIGGLEGTEYTHTFAGAAAIEGGDAANLCKDKSAGTGTAVLAITGEGEHVYAGSVGAGISIEKSGAGTQSFNGDMSAFDGDVTVSGGVLNIASGLSTADRMVSLGADTTLGAALELNGGSLTLDTTGATASLGGSELTVGEGTTLNLILAGTETTGDQITLLTGIGSLAGVIPGDGGLLGSLGDLFTMGAITDMTVSADAPVTADAGEAGAWADRLGRSELYYSEGELYLTLAANILAADPLYWDPTEPAGNGAWTGSNWSEEDKLGVDPGEMQNPWEGDKPVSVVFAGDTDATVTIDTDAVVTDMTVKDGAYTYAKDGETGSLSIEGKLTVEETGTADITGMGEVAVGSADIAGNLLADELNVSDKLTMTGGTLDVDTLKGDGSAEIAGGKVRIDGTTLSSTTVTGAEFMGNSTLAGSEDSAVSLGDVTVGDAASLTVTDATLTDQIDVAAGGTLVIGGAMHLDTTQPNFELDSKSTYAATDKEDDLGESIEYGGNGYVTINDVYTVITGDLTKVSGGETADWTVGTDARVGEYADGKVTISESKDTTTYWVNTSVTLSSVSGNFVTEGEGATETIKLNGGVLQMNEDTDLAIVTNNENPHGTASTIAMQGNATLHADQLTSADGTTVKLTGKTGNTLDLGDATTVDSTLSGLTEDTWQGTVKAGAVSGMNADLSALGNAASAVEVESVNAMSLKASTIGSLKSVGDVSLTGGDSAVTDMVIGGNLSMGATSASSLQADALTVNGADGIALGEGSNVTADTLTVGAGITLGKDSAVQADTLEVGGAISLEEGSTLSAGSLALGDEATVEFKKIGETPVVTVDSLEADTLQVLIDNSLLSDAADARTDKTQPIATIMEVTEGSGAEITLNGGSNIINPNGEKYGYTLDWNDTLLQLMAIANENYMKEKFADGSANGVAGATIMDDAFASDAIGVGGDLEKILDAVDNGVMTDEGMAAVAGSSTAALGMAFAGDVERQLRAIRNRTTTMGVNQCVVNEGMPYFNAWVNAEGNMAELDKDGTFAGYQLDSWGGTVGFDVDVNPNLTLGLAVTAMYGDLTVDGPDMLDGDMDTVYVSAFARYSARAWTHTFIGTIGTMDSSYERTVTHAGGGYTAEGETDGLAFGLMYEVGRVYALNKDASACLQPIFNVAYRHTTVGGYTEQGGDAALDIDDQTLDTVTIGAGARLQAVVGENLYNRTSLLELRALAKFDIGDRASEADVAFIGGGASATVESAELGAFGVELGAGLSIPMGDEDAGTLFFDVSAELRSGYTNLNGTVGYRINF